MGATRGPIHFGPPCMLVTPEGDGGSGENGGGVVKTRGKIQSGWWSQSLCTQTGAG